MQLLSHLIKKMPFNVIAFKGTCELNCKIKLFGGKVASCSLFQAPSTYCSPKK